MNNNKMQAQLGQVSGMCNQIWNLIQRELKNNKEDQTIMIGKLNSLISKQNDLNAKFEYICERLEKIESKQVQENVEHKEEVEEVKEEKINYITTVELTNHIIKEYTDCITGGNVKRNNLIYALNLLKLIEKGNKKSPYGPNSKFKGSDYTVVVKRTPNSKQTLEWTNEGFAMVIEQLIDNNFISRKVRK